MLLSILKSLGLIRPQPSAATAEGRDTLASAAEEAFEAARREASPFARDAGYDRVTALLARAHGPTLWRFCASHTGVDAATAEDLTQQALITLRDALPRFEGRSTLKTFLYGIATNLTRSWLATAQRRERIVAAQQEAIAATLHAVPEDADREAADTQARMAALEKALEQLDPRQAYLVRARLVEQLDYAAILPRFQARFGDSVKTVEGLRTLFFHAKMRLVALLRGDV